MVFTARCPSEAPGRGRAGDFTTPLAYRTSARVVPMDFDHAKPQSLPFAPVGKTYSAPYGYPGKAPHKASPHVVQVQAQGQAPRVVVQVRTADQGPETALPPLSFDTLHVVELPSSLDEEGLPCASAPTDFTAPAARVPSLVPATPCMSTSTVTIAAAGRTVSTVSIDSMSSLGSSSTVGGSTRGVFRSTSVNRPHLVYPHAHAGNASMRSTSSIASFHSLAATQSQVPANRLTVGPSTARSTSLRAAPARSQFSQPHQQQQQQQPRHLSTAAIHVSRRGNYDVVAVAFWLVVLDGGCELLLTKGRRALEAGAGRPNTSSGVRSSTGSSSFSSSSSSSSSSRGLFGPRPRIHDVSADGGPVTFVGKDDGAGASLLSLERWLGTGKPTPSAKFTLKVDKSPYPLLCWSQNGFFGPSSKIVRVYTSTKVDPILWEFVLETSKGPLYLRAASKDWFLIWTDGLKSILRYARELNTIR